MKFSFFRKITKILITLSMALVMGSTMFVHSQESEFSKYNYLKQTLSLNGDWQFADSTQVKGNNWDVLPVPSSWNTFTEYADYIGDAWYKKTISVPKNWSGKRIFLKFDAVYDIADVWCNEHYLGQHVGGYTPFEFDISPYISAGEKGVIKVKVNNEHVVGAWFQWGGINRGVHLIAHDALRLIRQKIEPVLDVVTGTAQVKLKVTVENTSDLDKSVLIRGTIKELDDVAFRLTGNVKAGTTTTLTNNIFLNTSQTRLWHFDDPQLYHLETVLFNNTEAIDVLQAHFGIRHINMKPDGLYLNGEKVRLMGYNRVHDHRAYGNTEPEHLVKSDIDMMKRSGANFSRIMHAPSSPELLDYCDKVGYLIWAEIPMWQTVYRVPMNNKEDAEIAKQLYPGNALKEMIQRDWNHPSIIGWSPGNELRAEASLYVETMKPLVKALDVTRPYANIHDAGFDKFSEGGYKNIDRHNVDAILMNKYGGTENKIKSVLKQHELVPELPIFYSEYGEKRDESLNFMVDFKPLWERLGKEPYVIGGAHWTFNDYRSYFKKTPPSQNRDWGIVDIWRNPKTLYYHMSEINAPVHDINVVFSKKEARVNIIPRGVLEIPSFTLRGYSWVYEILDENGLTVSGKIYNLPEIKPGTESFSETIELGGSKGKTLVVSILSNNGYAVAESRFDMITQEELPLPTFTTPKDPEIRKVLPLDKSFMVGVTSLEGDKGLEVEYGIKSGKYTKQLKANVKGAIRIRGLENGKTYFGRVRRVLAEGFSVWSNEFIVIPDGDKNPEPPKILGVIKGEDKLIVRLEASEKITGYRVDLNKGNVLKIEKVNPGYLILPKNSIKVSTVNKYGVSRPTSILMKK
ncbi:glycoside hydrolase family 2 protein [Flavivirga algicola]|uniref:Beta-galactosidase n=1 Tax=Flavivirga algicola TaxID=2729136 RepID=A0ABX1RVN8_9FLAO|nr:glycoside hydrolase family 2 TIM barrel-domain containing protein [Flavivirga algicola]NMH86833.1 hypothetical protein [Flavivirga algicola]